jgi:hypothetical protein
VTLAARRAAALARRSPAAPTLVEAQASEAAAPAAASDAPVLHEAETPVEVAIAARAVPLSDPRSAGTEPPVGGTLRGVDRPLPGRARLPDGGSPDAGAGRQRRTAPGVVPDGRPLAPVAGGPVGARGRVPVADLVVVGRARCPSCGSIVRRVRTPWGTDAPVGDEVVGAFDAAAGDQRVVVVHPAGISRCVVPSPGWSGQTVAGRELHACGGEG